VITTCNRHVLADGARHRQHMAQIRRASAPALPTAISWNSPCCTPSRNGDERKAPASKLR